MRSMATATPALESEQRDVASHAGDAPAVHRPTMEPGAFQRLPIVASAKELVRTSVRRASRVGNNNKLKNEAAKARNRCAVGRAQRTELRRGISTTLKCLHRILRALLDSPSRLLLQCRASRAMDTLMKEMCGPLGQYRSGFPSRERLHPFDAALLDLTVGGRFHGDPGKLSCFEFRMHACKYALADLLPPRCHCLQVGAERYRRTLAQLEAFKKTAVQASVWPGRVTGLRVVRCGARCESGGTELSPTQVDRPLETLPHPPW